jgi:gamma-glutamyl:cysteine ligase YbdK (ATP-grasp superfamily)
MGTEIERESFSDDDYARFAARLRDCLEVLREVLARPGFGTGATTIGAELEVFLIDVAGRPLAVNDAVVAAAADPVVTPEADRFNVECQTVPVELTGRPFARLGEQIERTLAVVREAAASQGGRLAIIGILPTLRAEDLQPEVLSASPRYRALSAGLRRVRQVPFSMQIEGPESLQVCCDDVTFEGANSAWQVHLKVAPAEFARTFNAAQVAIAPVLAAAGNSPTFLGRRLWQETRIALYRLSVDERAGASADDWRPARVSFGHGWVREGAWELFAESVAQHAPLLPLVADEDPRAAPPGAAPTLAELRVHQGTVWHWNRAVYDPAGGGHIRIEMRPLPAGPTIVDMLANAAFLLGLSLALAPQAERLTTALTFGQARRNFYEAARHGLDAELLWPTADSPSPRPVAARALVRQLIPLAHDALERAGVARAEAGALLDVVEARVASGMTGARWQLASLAALEQRRTRDAALAAMLERYLEHSASAAPVHTWPVALP